MCIVTCLKGHYVGDCKEFSLISRKRWSIHISMYSHFSDFHFRNMHFGLEIQWDNLVILEFLRVNKYGMLYNNITIRPYNATLNAETFISITSYCTHFYKFIKYSFV